MEINFTEISNVKYVDSRELAKCLSKHHRHVLDKIRKFKARIEGQTEQEIRIEYGGSQVKNVLLNLQQALELLECYKACNSVTELKIFLAGQSRFDLDEIWVQVLPFVRPIGTQVLLRQHGTLIEYSPDRACVRISSEPLLNMVKEKVGAIELAFTQSGYPTAVNLEAALSKAENSWSKAVVAGDRQTSEIKAELSLSPVNETEPDPDVTLASEAFSVFEFRSEAVRFLKIDGVDCVVGVDVARVLGYVDASAAVRDKVDSSYTCMGKLPIQGQTRTVTCVTEPGIYQLIFGSKLPQAKEFQRWVFEQVLPSIRKSGGYSVKSEGQPQTQLQVLAQTAQAMAEFEQRQLAVNLKFSTEIQTVKEQVEGIRSQIEEGLEQFKFDRDLAQDNLLQLPLASEAPPSVLKRNACNLLVRNYCRQSGRTYSEVWREIYTDMKYRYGYDAIARTNNHNRNIPKSQQRGYIDQCEIDGKLEELHKVISFKLYPNSAQK